MLTLRQLLAAALCGAASCRGFEHEWDTVQSQMFGWLGRDYLEGQLEWYAKNYRVIVIGSGPMDAGHAPGGGPCKPPGACIHNQSYPSQLVLAKQMKTLNPKLKLLLYEATGFGAQGFGQTEMQAHPEWCLTDDDGKPFERMINGQPHGCQFVDWRKPEVRDWWIHTVNQTGQGKQLFDGLLVDSAGPGSWVQFQVPNHTVSNASVKAIMQAKMDMLGEATKYFEALNDGYVVGNPTLEWDVIGPGGAHRGGPFPETYHWNYLRGTLDEMFGAFGTQVGNCGGAACGVPPGSAAKPGDWNATLMEASFDAIINETTLFHGGVTGAKDQLVLVRGYPGPLGTPFTKITTTMPGPNPRGPNATITVPTWAGPSVAALAGGSVAGAWAQGVAAEVEAPEPPEVGQCGSVLHDYFYYTWGKNRPDNDAGQGYAKTTADCCALCANHSGCEAFSFYKKGAATGQGICRLHKIPLPATVPGPASADYDSGNMKGPAPKVAGGPAPTPGPGPHPPPPPRPPAPPPPPTPPYGSHEFPKTTAEAAAVATTLLHEALAPYLIVAQPRTWFSYAWFYGVQSGWAPCPKNPGACLAPPDWYADLRRPLGPPLGPAVKSRTVYTRHFQHATATVDLSDRRKSKVVWS